MCSFITIHPSFLPFQSQFSFFIFDLLLYLSLHANVKKLLRACSFILSENSVLPVRIFFLTKQNTSLGCVFWTIDFIVETCESVSSIQRTKNMGDMKMRSILWMMLLLFGSFVIVSGERKLVKIQLPTFNVTTTQKHEQSFLTKAVDFLWKSDGSGYQHVWPVRFHFFCWILCLWLFKSMDMFLFFTFYLLRFLSVIVALGNKIKCLFCLCCRKWNLGGKLCWVVLLDFVELRLEVLEVLVVVAYSFLCSVLLLVLILNHRLLSPNVRHVLTRDSQFFFTTSSNCVSLVPLNWSHTYLVLDYKSFIHQTLPLLSDIFQLLNGRKRTSSELMLISYHGN